MYLTGTQSRTQSPLAFWSAELPLFYRRNLAVTKFQYPRVSTGAHPLTKKPEDSGYEIGPEPDEDCATSFSGDGEVGERLVGDW